MSDTRTVAVITGTRADYGILRPVLRKICGDAELSLRLIVCGMHISPEFGMTVQHIEKDGIPIAERIETMAKDDTPLEAAESIAAGITGFARSFSQNRPDILFIQGDRMEMLAAASAALPFAIPIAHLHGGELTFGAIDDATRHALTKMSHIHFVANEVYAKRVTQMGEDPKHVHITGGPGLDNLHDIELIGTGELEKILGMKLNSAPILCTFHPVTLESETTIEQLSTLLSELENVNRPIVFTYPNADPVGRQIIDKIKDFTSKHNNCCVVPNLGTEAYFSLMAHAAVMVGNSSSGITEAASFRLPVVNIGTRQAGRVRADNIIDVAPENNAIRKGLKTALSPEFRSSLDGLVNSYGDGHAAGRIVDVLREVSLTSLLLIKEFRDLESAV